MTRSQVIQFRVSAEERERIEALAAVAGIRMSDWIRQRALEETLEDLRVLAQPVADEPAPGKTTVDVLKRRGLISAGVPSSESFGCPVPGCAFAAKSPAARCGVHGRLVV